jgi:urea transport system permease protein
VADDARTEAVIRANLAESPIPPTEAEVSEATALQIFSVVGAEDWPWMWAVSDSLFLSLLFVVLVPGLLALVFGWLAFRSRVTGRVPVDPDPGDDAGAVALPVPERHRPAGQ